MKTWIKRTLRGHFGTAVLFGGLAACSHRHRHGGMMSEADLAQMRERFIGKVTRELSFDTAQAQGLGVLADALAAQRSALLADGVNPRAELQALVAGAQFDRSRAQALIDRKTGAVKDKAPAVVTAMADFYDSLQPAQQQKLRDFMTKGRGHGFGPIPLRRRDELGDLAGQVNTMASRLQKLLEGQCGLLLAISHELRSPLTRARQHAELLTDGSERDVLPRDPGPDARPDQRFARKRAPGRWHRGAAARADRPERPGAREGGAAVQRARHHTGTRPGAAPGWASTCAAWWPSRTAASCTLPRRSPAWW